VRKELGVVAAIVIAVALVLAAALVAGVDPAPDEPSGLLPKPCQTP
jgi:hypothetical protein